MRSNAKMEYNDDRHNTLNNDRLSHPISINLWQNMIIRDIYRI